MTSADEFMNKNDRVPQLSKAVKRLQAENEKIRDEIFELKQTIETLELIGKQRIIEIENMNKMLRDLCSALMK